MEVAILKKLYLFVLVVGNANSPPDALHPRVYESILASEIITILIQL